MKENVRKLAIVNPSADGNPSAQMQAGRQFRVNNFLPH
jgi:hypothetical protein